MKKDTKICLVVTIAIIASIGISAWVFHVDTKTPLSVFGLLVAISLPFYIRHRIRCNQKEEAVKYEMEKQIEQYVEELEILANDMANYNSKEYGQSTSEYLVSTKAEIESITQSLSDLAKHLQE